MEPNFESLIIIAEIGIAYVAFSTIVAALQPIRGKPFTHFQVLLVHFYVESGSLNVGLALLPLVLWNFLHDELLVWRLSNAIMLLVFAIYLSTYVVRRRKVRAPTPLPSLLVMVGYAIVVILLIVTLSEKFWLPSLGLYSACLYWGFSGSCLIFIYFFGSFIRRSAGRPLP